MELKNKNPFFRNFIVSEGFISKSTQRTIIKNKLRLEVKSPIFAQYEITSKCNYNCFFCYNVWKKEGEKENKDLPKKDQFKVIDKLAELEIFGLIISGGEPLIVPYLHEIIKKATAYKIETGIITNGSLLTKEISKKLFNSGLENIQISLHGINNATNDYITGTKNSFDKTFQGIKNALLYFDPEKINVNMVVIKKNINQMYDLAKKIKNIGVVNFSISSFDYTGKGMSAFNQAPNSEEFRHIFKELLRIKKELNIFVVFSGCFPLCILKRPIDKEVIDVIGNICDAGVTQIVIDSEGNIRPCVSYPQKIGNILKDDVFDIWKNSKILQKLRRLENVPDNCKSCKNLLYCMGGCRASGMEFEKKFNGRHPLYVDNLVKTS